jgi:serine O-acetyltransferase
MREELKLKHRLPEVTARLLESYRGDRVASHLGAEALPSQEAVVELVHDLLEILYPGYFGYQMVDETTVGYWIGDRLSTLYRGLCVQVWKTVRHECKRLAAECTHCEDQAEEISIAFLDRLAGLRRVLADDIVAALEGDPAAKSYDEIIFSYPCTVAITVYRLAHELHHLGVPLLPRIMTEYAHSRTGIDIHPGAHIGAQFFIDHGTGVVIGETCEIGDRVKVYQGVTLGALSFPRDAEGRLIRGHKRHPTIEDDVTIYSGATILGNVTIGRGSVIGGNVWLTESVPPGTRVTIKTPEQHFKGQQG